MQLMRKLVIQQLKVIGVKDITEAKDGVEAWAALEGAASSEPFQYVICDWNMPNLNGVELLKKCRTHEIYKNIAFLLVTADSEQDQVITAQDAGIDGYLAKPFSPEKFKTELTKVFNSRYS